MKYFRGNVDLQIKVLEVTYRTRFVSSNPHNQLQRYREWRSDKGAGKRHKPVLKKRKGFQAAPAKERPNSFAMVG